MSVIRLHISRVNTNRTVCYMVSLVNHGEFKLILF